MLILFYHCFYQFSLKFTFTYRRRAAKKAEDKRKEDEIESLKVNFFFLTMIMIMEVFFQNKNRILGRAVEEYYER